MCIYYDCDSHSKCVLETLEFTHAETGQTSEERIEIVKTNTHQGICHKDSSLIWQILSNLPDIIHLKQVMQIFRT